MTLYNRNELPETVVEFLDYIYTVRNRSEKTVSEYALDLRTFFRYMYREKKFVGSDIDFNLIDVSGADINFIKDIKLQDAYGFIAFCKKERHISSTSSARKCSALRTYFKYLTAKTLIKDNPMVNLDSPKLKKSLPKYLSLEESLDLLGCIDGKNRSRDYCIITIFLNCGIRLSELVGLNISDIRSDGSMRVLGKGNKERIVYLNDACRRTIDDYLKNRPVDSVKDKDALFISNRLTRISPKTVQHIVYEFLDKSGLGDRGLSVHKLRHTAATLMYQYGDVDVLALKEILGHESLSTTQIYTHVYNEQLKNAVESNPLANVVPQKKKNGSE